MGTKEVARLPELKWGEIDFTRTQDGISTRGSIDGLREGGVKGSPGGRVCCRIFLMLDGSEATHSDS